MRRKTKVLLEIMLFLMVNFSISAEWVNPGDKYIDVYKNYENAQSPIEEDNIQHFVYFARDRDAIHNHPFLRNSRFKGAQIMYSWQQLELSKDNYDFSIIVEDYNYLMSKGKKLFIQLQDATFSTSYKGVPAYLMADEYGGGVVPQIDDNGKHEGWTSKRWNHNVQLRFSSLLKALGQSFDGKIEGINLQETAIGLSSENNDNELFPMVYVESIKTNMLSLKTAFPESTTMQYANFMPGEWLPWEDFGYLKSIYQYGEQIGVGLGAPDLMVKRKGQLNHAITMMHEHSYNVPLGIAVQDGNYVGQTNTDQVIQGRLNIVPMLQAFAKDFLKVEYMFWVNQEPYFEQDVLPCFISR